MARKINLLMMTLLSICLGVNAAEIVAGKKEGSLALHVGDDEVLYEDITGDRYGVDRSFTYINGSPGLLVLSRDSFYFTLMIEGREIVVDCAYSDKRNSYNGARMTAGVCGLNIPLRKNYEEIAQDYSSQWRASIFSFDTSDIFKRAVDKDFLLGHIGEIEVFDRYSSASLTNSSPQKIIKSHNGCFDFGESVVFLVSSNINSSELKYLDVLRSEEPIKIQRLKKEDLIKLAIGQCSP